ncbi:hypothetical protein [Wukongibacter baidiensis]
MTKQNKKGKLNIRLLEDIIDEINMGRNIKLYNSLGYGRRKTVIQSILECNSTGVIITSQLLYETWYKLGLRYDALKNIILIDSVAKLLSSINIVAIDLDNKTNRVLIFDVSMVPEDLNILKSLSHNFDSIIYLINSIDKDPDPLAKSFK